MVVDFERVVGVGAGGAKGTWLTCLDILAKLAYIRSGITSLERLTAVKVSAALTRCRCMVLWAHAYLQLYCSAFRARTCEKRHAWVTASIISRRIEVAAGILGTAAFRHLTL